MDIELLKTKSLSDLREIAKLAGVKSVTTYKKSDLLQKLIDMANEAERQQEEQQTEKETAAKELQSSLSFPKEEIGGRGICPGRIV